MAARLEHANLCVHDADGVLRFLQTAFPEFRVRHEEVADDDALRDRLRAAGLRESTVPNAHPARRRIDFCDPDGDDWEFLQYLTDDPAAARFCVAGRAFPDRPSDRCAALFRRG